MIEHLDNIAYGKLTLLSGTFYFKVDKSANCYFLFCGNLRFEGDKSSLHTFERDSYQTI
jgi:hypothetical protein